jgi:GH15 family glucan-1,4-alpha-glucosidase
MSSRIEDYALIGNGETAAIVAKCGAIDWLCLPRFDSAACFAALLGNENQGRWLIAPVEQANVTRRYRPDTMILETTFETESGAVQLIDCMARRDGACDVIRQLRGLRGQVPIQLDLIVRFDYGKVVPRVFSPENGRIEFVAGPDRLELYSAADLENSDLRTQAKFEVSEGQKMDFSLIWSRSYGSAPPSIDAESVILDQETQWRGWMGCLNWHGPWREQIRRSLLTLKALTHFDTGGIVGAVTASLPESLGGSLNWDYRYCWLRDTTLTLNVLLNAGFTEEAYAWQEWLLRAIAGEPAQIQTIYGLAGERRLNESEVPWLSGYENSQPVRIGNAAAGQVQLDIYGEIMDALYLARKKGLKSDPAVWPLQCRLMKRLKLVRNEAGNGLWEARGKRKHYTYSKVMIWVAIDRAVRSVEEFGLDGPIDEWRELRNEIHEEVCARGFHEERGCFVQSYDEEDLDASLLRLPLVGFLPATDPRILNTVAAIERELIRDGYVFRHCTHETFPGMPANEGAFLACNFWLIDNYFLSGRMADATEMFQRLLDRCNDVGLLSEEYDPFHRRLVGNFPQALSHIALLNTAYTLAESLEG